MASKHGRDSLIKRQVSHGLMARISIGWQDLSTVGEMASTSVLKRRG
jgi:hypothetical protein